MADGTYGFFDLRRGDFFRQDETVHAYPLEKRNLIQQEMARE